MAADDEATGTANGSAGGDEASVAADEQPCETPAELLEWAESYARDVVAARGLAVDLAAVDWEVSHRAKRRAGATIHARVPGASVGEPVDWDDLSVGPDCTVRLTWRAYQALGHEAMAATVRHELVHVEQVQAYGTTGHGAAFRARAGALDAPRHCESFTPAPYVLTCRSCDGVVARRYRRSKLVTRHDEYRSRCCGAALSLETDAGA